MKKIAAIFSGQGSQYVGMGKDLYDNYGEAKEVFEQAKEVLKSDILDIMFYGDKDVLRQTENAQIAVFLTSMAAYKVFTSVCKVKPTVTAGHSLGELSALTAAGAFSFEDALFLVRDRAEYMKDACKEQCGTMYAVRDVHPERVKEICAAYERVCISNYNTREQTVISGEKEMLINVVDNLKADGAVVQELEVNGAFHSQLMESASEKMKERLKMTVIAEPEIPVISNTTATFEGREEIRDNLYHQIIMPVRWSETIDIFRSLGISAAIEFGPGHVLTNMIKKQNNGIDTYLFEKKADIDVTIKNVQKNYSEPEINFFEKCLSMAVCSKNYNNSSDGYETFVVKNVNRIRSLIEKDILSVTEGDRAAAYEALQVILRYKKVPREEMEKRLHTIHAIMC